MDYERTSATAWNILAGATPDEEIECEHYQHAERHRDGRATHLLRTNPCNQPGCTSAGRYYLVCSHFITRNQDRGLTCGACSRAGRWSPIIPFGERVEVIRVFA